MTDFEKLRWNTTIVKLVGLLVSTGAICFTIAIKVEEIKTSIKIHDYKISESERKISNLENWKEKVTAYYLPNQK